MNVAANGYWVGHGFFYKIFFGFASVVLIGGGRDWIFIFWLRVQHQQFRPVTKMGHTPPHKKECFLWSFALF